MEVYVLCVDAYGYPTPIAVVTSIEEAKKLLKEKYKEETVEIERNGEDYYLSTEDEEYSLEKFTLNKLEDE